MPFGDNSLKLSLPKLFTDWYSNLSRLEQKIVCALPISFVSALAVMIPAFFIQEDIMLPDGTMFPLQGVYSYLPKALATLQLMLFSVWSALIFLAILILKGRWLKLLNFGGFLVSLLFWVLSFIVFVFTPVQPTGRHLLQKITSPDGKKEVKSYNIDPLMCTSQPTQLVVIQYPNKIKALFIGDTPCRRDFSVRWSGNETILINEKPFNIHQKYRQEACPGEPS